jgi:outer membrane protein OmpA-like peptidoglycan-associated protein
MRHLVATVWFLSLTLLVGGCATKKYVRNTNTPIQAKVDQVGEQTQKQGQEIQDNKAKIAQVDESAQSGISAAKERAMTADNHAGEAMKSAGEAMNRANQVGTELNQRVDQTNGNVNQLRTVVSNLDDYKIAGETSVLFRFNKYALDKETKDDLDKLVANLSSAKRYFISVEGFTDTVGSAAYNEELSRKRADAVVQYLVAKHNVPIYRIHMIGLGKEKPVDLGKDHAARAKNRRVEVKIYSADQPAVAKVNPPAR